jgi:hypothetical protein
VFTALLCRQYRNRNKIMNGREEASKKGRTDVKDKEKKR